MFHDCPIYAKLFYFLFLFQPNKIVPNLFNLADTDDLLIMSTLHAYWAQITADTVPNFTLIAHACSACCGKIHFKRMGLLWCPRILHYVAVDLNPGANRTIGILPFVGPLGYVMQPSNRGQHILLQECPNSLRHYFLHILILYYLCLMQYVMQFVTCTVCLECGQKNCCDSCSTKKEKKS